MFNQCNIKIFIYLLFVAMQVLLISVNATPLQDPTRPPNQQLQKKSLYKGTSQYRWKLSSTLISSERKIATINGKLVRPGERINGAILVDIDAWNVTLIKNNKEFKVYLFNRNKIKNN